MSDKLKALRKQLKTLEKEYQSKLDSGHYDHELALELDDIKDQFLMLKWRKSQKRALNALFELEKSKPQRSEFESEEAFLDALKQHEKVFFAKDRAFEKRFRRLVLQDVSDAQIKAGVSDDLIIYDLHADKTAFSLSKSLARGEQL